MAELVGVISGAVTIGALAANVATSVAKLKSYWDQLENAPEDVQRLIEEIEIFSLVLDEIKDDQGRNLVSSLLLDNTSLSKCLENCERAADRLRRLTDEMGDSIDTSDRLKKKWKSAKVLLKKDKIEKFKLGLESAIRLLSLSHQSYTRALLRLQPDIIFARVSQAIASTTASSSIELENYQRNSSPATSSRAMTSRQYYSSSSSRQYSLGSTSAFNAFGILRYSTKQYSKNSNQKVNESSDIGERQEIIVWYRGPAWLVNRAWKFHARKAYNGWNFSIRQYNVIHSSSTIFHYARGGNVKGLQKLFDRRQASPFDCNEDGKTPLHEAAAMGEFSVCKLLIDLGEDANYIPNCCSVIRVALLNAVVMKFRDKVQERLDTIRLLSSKVEVEPDELRFYRGPREGFILLQQYIDPQYYEKSLEERVVMAISLTILDIIGGPDLFWAALACDRFPCTAVRVKNTHNETVLHAVGKSVGRVAKTMVQEPYPVINELLTLQRHKENLEGWRLILQELINHDVDLHAIAFQYCTPFIYLLKGVLEGSLINYNHPWPFVLDIWLSILMDCGVDLCKYGQREQELHEECLSSWDYPLKIMSYEKEATVKSWYLVSFTYGSSPSDWHVVVERRVEKLDEDFNQIGAVPGSWVED